jgi:hypothetical protein
MARLQLTVCMFALHAACMRSDHEPSIQLPFRKRYGTAAAPQRSMKGSVHIGPTAVAIFLWMLAEAAELHTVPSGLYGIRPRDGSMHLASTSKADEVWLNKAAS